MTKAHHMGREIDASENYVARTSPETFTESEVREMLRAACKEAGSVYAWAKREGVSISFATDVLNARRPLGPSLARAIGFEPVNLWRKLS